MKKPKKRFTPDGIVHYRGITRREAFKHKREGLRGYIVKVTRQRVS